MNPDDALDLQIQMYRQMTDEQRLKIALDLHELACNVASEGIRHQFPNADEAEIGRHLRERIMLENTRANDAERAVAMRRWSVKLDAAAVLGRLLDGTIKHKTT